MHEQDITRTSTNQCWYENDYIMEVHCLGDYEDLLYIYRPVTITLILQDFRILGL